MNQRAMNTRSAWRVLSHGAMAVAVILLFASVNSQAQCPGTCNSANGCNGVSVKVTLKPLKVGTDYVGLVTSCGGATVKQCGLFSFATTVADTTTSKCLKIASALNVTACSSIGYTFVGDPNVTCAASQTVTVTDSCGGGVLEFQTKNEGGDLFSSNTGSSTEVDYENDMIAPSCKDPDNTAGNLNEMTNQATLAGTATGVAIDPNEPAHVEITVDQSSNGGPVVTAEFNTKAGVSSSDIADNLEEGLSEQGVQGVTVVGGRSIRVAQPATGNPIRVGIATSDTGINFDSRVAPVSRLPFPGAATIPTLSTWSTVLLVGLLLGTGAWLIRRRKQTA
jgi:hypothetical protein